MDDDNNNAQESNCCDVGNVRAIANRFEKNLEMRKPGQTKVLVSVIEKKSPHLSPPTHHIYENVPLQGPVPAQRQIKPPALPPKPSSKPKSIVWEEAQGDEDNKVVTEEEDRKKSKAKRLTATLMENLLSKVPDNRLSSQSFKEPGSSKASPSYPAQCTNPFVSQRPLPPLPLRRFQTPAITRGVADIPVLPQDNRNSMHSEHSIGGTSGYNSNHYEAIPGNRSSEATLVIYNEGYQPTESDDQTFRPTGELDIFKEMDKMDRMLLMCEDLARGRPFDREMLDKVSTVLGTSDTQCLTYLYMMVKISQLDIEHFLQIYATCNIRRMCQTPWRFYFRACRAQQVQELSEQQLAVFENMFELIKTQKSNLMALQELIDVRDHRLQDIDKAELKVLFGGINAIRDTTSKFYDECMTMLGQDMFMRKIFSILYAYLDNGLFAANAEYFRASVDRTVLIAKHQLSNTSANFNIPMQQLTRFQLVCKEVVNKLNAYELTVADSSGWNPPEQNNSTKPPSFSFLKAEAERCHEMADRVCHESQQNPTVPYMRIKELLVEGRNLIEDYIPEQELHRHLYVEAYKIKPHERSNLSKLRPKFKPHSLLLSNDLVILASEERLRLELVRCVQLMQVTIQANAVNTIQHVPAVSTSSAPTFSLLQIAPIESVRIDRSNLSSIDISSKVNSSAENEQYAIECHSRENLENFIKLFVDLKQRQKGRLNTIY